MTEDVPAAFSAMLCNIAILGRWLHDEFDPEKKLVITTPSTDFAFNPYYSKKALRKLLENDSPEEDELIVSRWRNVVVGGDFLVRSQFIVPGDSYRGFCLDVCFSLRTGGGTLDATVGALVFGNDLDDNWTSLDPFSIELDEKGEFNLDENKMRTLALKNIAKAISKCIRGENNFDNDAKARFEKIMEGCKK